MEYMAGGSVKDELRNYGALTESVRRNPILNRFESFNYSWQ